MSIAVKTKNNEQITLSRKEYDDLLDKKMRFDFLRNAFDEDLFSPPPTQDSNEVVEAFKSTNKYTKEFIDSLEKGLKRSSNFSA
jgi:hypothetical protein